MPCPYPESTASAPRRSAPGTGRLLGECIRRSKEGLDMASISVVARTRMTVLLRTLDVRHVREGNRGATRNGEQRGHCIR